jgi:hypothetical protein
MILLAHMRPTSDLSALADGEVKRSLIAMLGDSALVVLDDDCAGAYWGISRRWLMARSSGA